MGRFFTLGIGAATVMLAVLFNALQGFNLMDIMFRLFSAFGPAIMLPLILGLLSRKLNARGALWGVFSGSVTGVTLGLANFLLIQMCADQMKTNPSIEFWLRSGWNSAATFLSVLATILGMWLGTVSKPTPEDERGRATRFFDDLKKPFLAEGSAKKVLSPFRIIGLMLIAFGVAISAISLLVLFDYQDARAFRIDLIIALVLIALGAMMRIGSRKIE